MKKTLIIIFASFLVTVLGFYFLNPFKTASFDPRARLLGFIPYRISADSMLPTLKSGDIVLVQTFAYRNKLPERGDIIVFLYPLDTKIAYLKRVVAVGPSTVSIHQANVIVNGEKIIEEYVAPQFLQADFSQEMPEVVVPKDFLFVMGDNRDNSNDSRFWGLVPLENLIGKVVSH